MKKNYIPVNRFCFDHTYFDGIDPFIKDPRSSNECFFQSKNVAKIITIGLSPVFISKMSDILNEKIYYFERTIYYFHMQKIYL